jgi:hypothetical protein
MNNSVAGKSFAYEKTYVKRPRTVLSSTLIAITGNACSFGFIRFLLEVYREEPIIRDTGRAAVLRGRPMARHIRLYCFPANLINPRMKYYQVPLGRLKMPE